ncbi:hypothetical protein TNCV_3487691 [Trichonephila clavipes]|nr:hypothetical protein TNCV_3487691 [Trichonephila clavipes]
MASSLDFNESGTRSKWEYLSEIDEYDSDFDTDLSICDEDGEMESLVYADNPQTLDHLEDNVRRVIADIRPQMLEKVIENLTSRLDYIGASRGSPMPEIIFKMTAMAGSDVVQSGRPIFDDFFQHLWPYIGNNTANVVFQKVKRLWIICIDQ